MVGSLIFTKTLVSTYRISPPSSQKTGCGNFIPLKTMGFVLAAFNWELQKSFPSFLLAFVLVFHLLVLHSSGFSCPSSIECGKHGPIKFPFTNITYRECGLLTLSCHEPALKVILGDLERSIQVSNFTDDAINISDLSLKNLIDSKNCYFFNYIHPKNTGSISYTISPNLTLFKCLNSNPEIEDPTAKHFFDNYTQYTGEGCKGFTVYYLYPNDTVPTQGRIPGYTVYYSYPNDTVLTPGSTPGYCKSFQLPIVSSIENRNLSDPFSLLTSDFYIEYHVSKECHVCRNNGGQCSRDPPEFKCLNKIGDTEKTGGGSRLALILGIVIPGVILLPCFILIIQCRKKWRKYFSSYIIWRNTSSDHLSKGGHEEGSVYFGIPIFSYSELKEATHNFHPSKELGDGGFGIVYHGKLQDGREVAVKHLYQHNYKRVAQFLNEIEILTHLRHPSLVTLYGCTSCHSQELLLVYEYIPNGTVSDHLHGDRAKDHPLPWPIRMNIAIETACALVYLHASEIIHRDVKTNNILLDNNFCVKVADFGLSRLFPTDVSHVSTAPQGTPGYVDPDYHQCYQLTDKSDVYSFGVVLIELISSLPAVDISRHRHEINLANLAISRIQDGAFKELIDPSLGFNSDSSVERMTTAVAEVAFRCLQLEKEMRPRMNEVLEALKGIHDYKDDEIEEMPPPSPDGDNVELLNSSKVPPSQDSATIEWFSSSTASISSV